jgi:PAS domain S-box-containing protein
MHIYLLAIDLFSLTAWLLALASLNRGMPAGRILPLFLLVISRSLGLLASLVVLPAGLGLAIFNTLELFSTLCLVWSLLGPVSPLGYRSRRLIWAGAVGAGWLVVLPLLPPWPVPWQIHNILIAIGGASLIALTWAKISWLDLLGPVALALATFLGLVGPAAPAWLVTMLAYAGLIGAIHWRSLQSVTGREELTHNLVQEVLKQGQEQQRFLEISASLSAIPNLNHSLEHIVRTIAHSTQADQAAIFVLDNPAGPEARLLTLYSPRRPFHIHQRAEVVCFLPDCPPLQAVINNQQPLLLPQPAMNGLATLYGLWDESLSGPTLLQPLLAQGRPIGVLMVGNPLSQKPIRDSDIRLCRSLAAQISILVEHRRRYFQLEGEALAMAQVAKAQRQPTAVWQSAILESINEGVIVSNAQGRVQYANRAAEVILGKPGQTLIGQEIGTIYRALDNKRPLAEGLTSFAQRAQPLPTFREEADGAIQGRLIPWRNEQQVWLGIIAIFRDVTREVKADRARNDFINALSHQLRAPLAMIKGYSELIVGGMTGPHSTQQLQPQRIIYRHAEKMAEILDDAIKVSAQTRHRLLPRFAEISAKTIIAKVSRDLARLIQQKELKVSLDIEAQLPTIIADAAQLYRILHNLLSNACDFSPPGGEITLRARVQAEPQRHSARPELLISISDSGAGIPPERLHRLFDQFYQDHPEWSEARGVGLGLTVVKELVELHRGRVWAESVVGRGSTFHLALPISQDY